MVLEVKQTVIHVAQRVVGAAVPPRAQGDAHPSLLRDVAHALLCAQPLIPHGASNDLGHLRLAQAHPAVVQSRLSNQDQNCKHSET